MKSEKEIIGLILLNVGIVIISTVSLPLLFDGQPDTLNDAATIRLSVILGITAVIIGMILLWEYIRKSREKKESTDIPIEFRETFQKER